MKVQKRNSWGSENNVVFEVFDKEKIKQRIKYLAVGSDGLGGEDVIKNETREIAKIGPPLNNINIEDIVKKTSEIIIEGIKTSEIDEWAAKCCLEKSLESLEYLTLAARLIVSSLHKDTPERFIDSLLYLYHNKTKNGEPSPYVRKDIVDLVIKNQTQIEKMIVHERDYLLDYFGLYTLIRPSSKTGYLFKNSSSAIIDRPQYLFMRTAIEIHRVALENEDPSALQIIKDTYDIMSLKMAVHATPTIANSCTNKPQLASCFLSCVFEDSIEGIFESVKKNSILCKNMGGLGLYLGSIRPNKAIIKSSGGESRGIKPLIKVLDSIFGGYLDQGGKRKGSIALYLDVYHPDFEEFINMPRNTQGPESDRARELFYSVVVNDVFMKACEYECDGQCNNDCPGMHYYMSPDECPDLLDTMGSDFESLYNNYVSNKKYYKSIHARELMFEMIFTMINSGKLYIFNRDAANRSNNLDNIGNINISNLCTEMTLPVRQKNVNVSLLGDIEYLEGYNTNLISVCNLASVKLDSYIEDDQSHVDNVELNVHDFDGTPTIKYFKLAEFRRVIGILVRNIDNIIDITYYPEELTRDTNTKMRPIGLGVQGLADMFNVLNLPYDSDKAQLLNYYIWYWTYAAALEATCKLAKERGSYKYFKGSRGSRGELQFDSWPGGLRPSDIPEDSILFNDDKHIINWDNLRNMCKGGMRNSLLTAPMPTASTSQILGSAESFEPYTNNIFSKTTLAGTFSVINPHLFKTLEKNKILNKSMIDQLITDNGSVKNLNIPAHAKNVYRTIYEVSMKKYIKMSADRGRFICQSQSLNHYWEGSADIIKHKIYSSLMYGWKLGLKTLCYYTRTKGATGQKIGVEEKPFNLKEELAKAKAAAEAGEACTMCSS
jgi:ribonucleoside-diphosphate reductase alpha subunit